MNAYQRAAIHDAIEVIAEAREKLAQQERELQELLKGDRSPQVHEIIEQHLGIPAKA
jgi:hypothetical protein